MFCTNCQFEIKGEGRKECPVCGGPLVEYSDLKTSSGESKNDSEAEKFIETTGESKDSEFFDLESALNANDELPSFSEQEPKSVIKKRSREDMMANPPKKPDPIEGFVSTATKKSERKQKHSSKLLPVIVVVGVLIIAVQTGIIFFLKSQQKINPLIAQLEKGVEQKAFKIFNAVMGLEKGKTFVEKEDGFVGHVQTEQEEPSQKKTASVSEKTPLAMEKVVQVPPVNAVPKTTIKKKEKPLQPVKKKAPLKTLYSIHAGSYKTEKVAVGESNRLKQWGFHAYVQVTDLQKGEIWYRVKIGDFSTRKDARKVQDELKQKAPKLKSILVKRKAESKKALVEKEERKSIAIKEPVPVDVSKPVKEEVSQQKSGSVETIPPVEEIVVTGEVQRLVEMELVPDDTPSEQKEISQQKPVTVKTVADVVPEEDDPFIAVSVPPQSTIEKVEDVVIPDEMTTSEKVVYSINANSYPVEKIAVDEVIRLKLLGFDDVYIRTDDLGEGEIWYRVMIGKFSTREDAQTVQDELIQKDAELKSIIIKLENESIE